VLVGVRDEAAAHLAQPAVRLRGDGHSAGA
jgi:hypothetical protein